MSDKPEPALPEFPIYEVDGLHGLAMNYRGAPTLHAEAAWVELLAFVQEARAACFRAGMERAAEIAQGEKLTEPQDNCEGDEAYDTAVDHVVAAIRKEAGNG